MKYKFITFITFILAPALTIAAACDGAKLMFGNGTNEAFEIRVNATNNSSVYGVKSKTVISSEFGDNKYVKVYSGDGSGGSATGYITWKRLSNGTEVLTTYSFDSPLMTGAACINKSEMTTSGGWDTSDIEVSINHFSQDGLDINSYDVLPKD